MIARLASFILIVWALGFALFAITLGKPARADVEPTQAIVALTGGKYRIEHAAKLLGEGKADLAIIRGDLDVPKNAQAVATLRKKLRALGRPHSPASTRKFSWVASRWYLPPEAPGLSTPIVKPSAGISRSSAGGASNVIPITPCRPPARGRSWRPARGAARRAARSSRCARPPRAGSR